MSKTTTRDRKGNMPSSVVRNLVALIAVFMVGVYVLYFLAKYVFGIDIFDFTSPRGKLTGFGITGVFLYSFYNVLNDPREIGAIAVYNPNDKRFDTATAPLVPSMI